MTTINSGIYLNASKEYQSFFDEKTETENDSHIKQIATPTLKRYFSL